jgi:hypothetical protein
MSQYVADRSDRSDRSPYAYRLPPDTFLSRRDPGWYIGATPTPEQQAEITRWTNAVASLQQSEAEILRQAQAAPDGKAKVALLTVVLPQVQSQIMNALLRLQAAQKAAGVQVTVPTPESFAQLEALVKKARDDFEANAAAWIDDMRSVIGRLTPDFITSMQSLVDNIQRNVFEGSVPRLMLRVKSGEFAKQKDIERILKISAEALKSTYDDAVKAFRDMGPISTLLYRAVSGLVQAAEAVGRYALQAVVQTVKEVIREAQEEATKNPLGFALAAGGAFAALALYLYIKKG